MNAKELADCVKTLIESAPKLDTKANEVPDNAISFENMHQLINDAGYRIEAQQRGIMGTFLYLMPED